MIVTWFGEQYAFHSNHPCVDWSYDSADVDSDTWTELYIHHHPNLKHCRTASFCPRIWQRVDRKAGATAFWSLFAQSQSRIMTGELLPHALVETHERVWPTNPCCLARAREEVTCGDLSRAEKLEGHVNYYGLLLTQKEAVMYSSAWCQILNNFKIY